MPWRLAIIPALRQVGGFHLLKLVATSVLSWHLKIQEKELLMNVCSLLNMTHYLKTPLDVFPKVSLTDVIPPQLQ